MLYLCIFKLENVIAIVEINTLEFVKVRIFAKKQKCLNLGPKISELGIFGLEFENNIDIFESVPSNLSNCEFLSRNKNAYF